jgi:hypothetical protein
MVIVGTLVCVANACVGASGEFAKVVAGAGYADGAGVNPGAQAVNMIEMMRIGISLFFIHTSTEIFGFWVLTGEILPLP